MLYRVYLGVIFPYSLLRASGQEDEGGSVHMGPISK